MNIFRINKNSQIQAKDNNHFPFRLNVEDLLRKKVKFVKGNIMFDNLNNYSNALHYGNLQYIVVS